MANEQEIKEMAEKTGMTEEYVKSMLEFKENYEKRKEEVTPMAEALGMTPEQYISEIDRQESNLYFLTTKGFDIKTMVGLQQAKEWLETADSDELMLGEPTGDAFDIQMGSLRRGMLIKTVEREMKKC